MGFGRGQPPNDQFPSHVNRDVTCSALCSHPQYEASYRYFKTASTSFDEDICARALGGRQMCSRFANTCLGLRVALNHVGSLRVRWGPAPVLIVIRLPSLVSAAAHCAIDDVLHAFLVSTTSVYSVVARIRKTKLRCYDPGLVSDSLSSHVVPFKLDDAEC